MNIYIRKGVRCCVCEAAIDNNTYCAVVGNANYLVGGLVTNVLPQPMIIITCSRECLDKLLEKQKPVVEG